MPLDVGSVVVGIVAEGNRFLVARRRLDEKKDPRMVCFPVGHVKPGESLEDTLKREMMEELGIKVKEAKFVCRNFYGASNGESQNTYCDLFTDYVGTPVCKAAQEIFWEDDIKNLSLEVHRKTIWKMKE
jgi:8-oxo-dGTP diphosphatase